MSIKAKEIITQIFKKIGLIDSMPNNPIVSKNQTAVEVMDLINDRLYTLSTEQQFSQLKKECRFKVYPIWDDEEIASDEFIHTHFKEGDDIVIEDSVYNCIQAFNDEMPVDIDRMIKPTGTGKIIPTITAGFTYKDEFECFDFKPMKFKVNQVGEKKKYYIDNYNLWEVVFTKDLDGNECDLYTLDIESANYNQGLRNYFIYDTNNDLKIIFHLVSPILIWEYLGSKTSYRIKDLAPDFVYMSPDSFYIMNGSGVRLQQIPDSKWQEYKSNNTTEYDYYTLRDGKIVFLKDYEKETEMSFIYYSRNMVIDKLGEEKEKIDDLEDTIKIPEQVLIWGVVLQWALQNGQAGLVESAQDNYKTQLDRALADNLMLNSVSLIGECKF